jgi:hypothetical protein
MSWRRTPRAGAANCELIDISMRFNITVTGATDELVAYPARWRSQLSQLRKMHTLKGTAYLFLAGACHGCECGIYVRGTLEVGGGRASGGSFAPDTRLFWT